MIPNTTDAPATPSRSDEAQRTEPLPMLDLSKPIEVASSGTGSTNDTSGTDKPPRVGDPIDLSALL